MTLYNINVQDDKINVTPLIIPFLPGLMISLHSVKDATLTTWLLTTMAD